MFLSVLVMAAYNVLARPLLKSFRPLELTYLLLGSGFAAFLLCSVVAHLSRGTIHELFIPLTSGKFLVSVIYLGILASFVTALTANYSLSKLDASLASVFSNLSTVVSIAAGAVFLREEIKLYHIADSALIILGVLGMNLFQKKRLAGVFIKQTSKTRKDS